MHRRRVLGNGQVEVRRERRADYIETAVRVYRAPVNDATQRAARRWLFVPSDATFDWADQNLFGIITEMIEAQIKVLPHALGMEFATNPNSGEVQAYRDTEGLFRLLLDGTREEFSALLRAPDVMDSIEHVQRGRHQGHQRRLARLIRRRTSPRSGAPIKDADKRVDLSARRRVG